MLLEGDLSGPDQEEAIGRLPLVEHERPRRERQHAAAPEQLLELGLGQHARERVRAQGGEIGARIAHGAVPFAAAAPPPSEARIAATSSVMSMPTGHQVMQRPQPTHPEVPY